MASSIEAAIGIRASTFVNLKSCRTLGRTPTAMTRTPRARERMKWLMIRPRPEESRLGTSVISKILSVGRSLPGAGSNSKMLTTARGLSTEYISLAAKPPENLKINTPLSSSSMRSIVNFGLCHGCVRMVDNVFLPLEYRSPERSARWSSILRRGASRLYWSHQGT